MSALLDDAGFIFTWGSAKTGLLGHNSRHANVDPTAVCLNFFGDKRKGTYVVDIFPGSHQCAVLTAQQEIDLEALEKQQQELEQQKQPQQPQQPQQPPSPQPPPPPQQQSP